GRGGGCVVLVAELIPGLTSFATTCRSHGSWEGAGNSRRQGRVSRTLDWRTPSRAWPDDGGGFSLSPGERAGVRGKKPLHVKSPRTWSKPLPPRSAFRIPRSAFINGALLPSRRPTDDAGRPAV